MILYVWCGLIAAWAGTSTEACSVSVEAPDSRLKARSHYAGAGVKKTSAKGPGKGRDADTNTRNLRSFSFFLRLCLRHFQFTFVFPSVLSRRYL